MSDEIIITPPAPIDIVITPTVGAPGSTGATGVYTSSIGVPPTDTTQLWNDLSTDASSPYSAANVTYFGALGNGVHDDTLAIQLAVDTGQPVYLPAGDYLITKPITLKPYQTFFGSGIGSSTITLASTFSGTYGIGCIASPSPTFWYAVTIKDITITAQIGATCTHAVYLRDANDCLISNVRVYGVISGGSAYPTNGITLDSTVPCTANKIVNCYIRNCGGKGVYINNNVTDTQMVAIDSGACLGPAFYLGSPNNQLTGCIGWGSTVGLFISSYASTNWISGCRFDYNTQEGVYIEGASGVSTMTTISGCFIYNNSAAGSGTHPQLAVNSLGNHIVISGTMFANANNTASAAINLANGHSYVTITGCDVTQVPAAGIVGATSAAHDIVNSCNGAVNV